MIENTLLQWAVVILALLEVITIQLGFRLVKYYVSLSSKLEFEIKNAQDVYTKTINDERDRYERLVENKDTTKLEEKLSVIERDLKAVTHLHEQEMERSFGITKAMLDNAEVMLSKQNEAFLEAMKIYNATIPTKKKTTTQPE